MLAGLVGPIKIDHYTISKSVCILFRQREDEGVGLPNSGSLRFHEGTALRLAKEDNVRGEGEVFVVSGGIASQ